MPSDCLNLGSALSGTDDEIIGYDGEPLEVEYDRILGLLIERCLRGL